MVDAPWRINEDYLGYARILRYVRDHEHDELYPSLGPLCPGDERAHVDRLYADVKSLDQAGRVTAKFLIGGGRAAAIRAQITVGGREWLNQLDDAKTDKGQRRWATRDSLLEFLYDEDASNSSRAAIVTNLPESSKGRFYEEQFTSADVEDASEFLAEQGLIKGYELAEFRGPTHAWLTTSGFDCAENAGCDVKNYLKKASGVGDSYVISNSNVNLAAGDNARQTMHVGTDGEGVLLLMKGLQQLLLEGGDFDESDELQHDVDDALADLQSDSPTGEPTRRFAGKAKKLAKRVSDPVAAHLITRMSDVLISDADKVIHAVSKAF